jgi:hypothetical protein
MPTPSIELKKEVFLTLTKTIIRFSAKKLKFIKMIFMMIQDYNTSPFLLKTFIRL